jgi:hypothetical protein
MSRARPLEPGPEPRAAGPGLGPGPDRAWDRAQGSPGLGPRLPGPGPAHASALLAIYVYIFYTNLRYFTLFYVNSTLILR